MKHLPPLNALPAFEAAARLLSVKEAADELAVTPGAVSQMLKALETQLGVKLFDRVNRGIRLTEAGREYLPPVRAALRQIAEATRRQRESCESSLLTLSVTPFFASAWLVPRLAAFHTAHPDLDLHLVTGDGNPEGVDAAIRHGCGGYPGLVSDLVMAVEVVPVAAPALVERFGTPDGPADLLRWPRVHNTDRAGWCSWFRFQGIDEIGPQRGTAFGDPGLLLQAVLAGQGAGLLPAAMVALDVEAGRLVRLAEVALIERFAYYLVYPEAAGERPKIAAFRHWLLDAAGADRPLASPGAETSEAHEPAQEARRAPRSRAAALGPRRGAGSFRGHRG